MANKKAKSKTTKKKTTPVNKKTTTRVVSSEEVSKETKPGTKKQNILKRFFSYVTLPSTVKMIVLELLGTFVLATTFILTQGHPMYMMFSLIGVFLALTYATGGFFNPALTFGAWVSRRICGAAMVVQIIAQFLGSMLNLVMLEVFVKASGSSEFGAAELFTFKAIPAGKEWYLFIAEVIGILILSLVLARIMKAKQSNRMEKAMAIGAAGFAAMLLAGTLATYVGGMSVLNPSLLMSLKAFTGETWVWVTSIYIIAPLIGGALGFVLAGLLEEQEKTKITTKK